MSGPKVVRVVTRDEILAICRGLLARVDAALEEWVRIGSLNNIVDAAATAATIARRQTLADMIAADRFVEFQKQAPQEEVFLRDNIQARLATASQKAAEQRSMRRRESEAATSLLKQMRQLDQPPDPELEKALLQGEAGAIAQGLRLLADHAVKQKSSPGFAEGLRDPRTPSDFAEWLALQPQVQDDPEIERIEKRIDELRATNAEDPARWQVRLDEARGAAMPRRQLLLDSLEVETGRALTASRRQAALVLDLRLALAELAAEGAHTPGARENAAIFDSGNLEKRIEDAKVLLAAHRATASAQARRSAVLEGLAKLGYEVTEEMSTALANDSRLVMKSATRPDYGVELSASSGGERLQLRPVAFDDAGGGPDPSRDRDAETIWCGDVSSLQASLAATGGDLTIERALPVGATPLKRIAVGDVDRKHITTMPIAREQKLP